MGGGLRHRGAHHLLVERDSPVHRARPEAKVVALVLFAVALAATPERALAAFALHGAVLALVAGAARLPAGTVRRRALVALPFLGVAALLPFAADGPRVVLGPLAVSEDGLWAGGALAARAVLGATAAVVLTATTSVADLLAGLAHLRLPRVVVGIVASMLRYLDLVADQLHRTRLAMAARGHDPRWLWQARPLAAGAGTLFVRTYERGERVHQAMLARGFTGRLPDLRPPPAGAPAIGWAAALAPALVSLLVAVGAILR